MNLARDSADPPLYMHASGDADPVRHVLRELATLRGHLERVELALGECMQSLGLEPGINSSGGCEPTSISSDQELSRRESQVLRQVVDGYATRAIGARLHISPYTVRNHLKAIYRKLEVHSREQLIRKLAGWRQVPHVMPSPRTR